MKFEKLFKILLLTTALYDVDYNVSYAQNSVSSEYTKTTIFGTSNVVNSVGAATHPGSNSPDEINIIVGTQNTANNSQGMVITGSGNQLINSDIVVTGQKNVIRNTYGNVIGDGNAINAQNSTANVMGNFVTITGADSNVIGTNVTTSGANTSVLGANVLLLAEMQASWGLTLPLLVQTQVF